MSKAATDAALRDLKAMTRPEILWLLAEAKGNKP